MSPRPATPSPSWWRPTDRGTLLVWGVLVLASISVLVAGPSRFLPIPDPHRILVESRLPDTVLLDIRTADARGSVIGPPVRTFAPGDTVTFITMPGAAVCLRIVMPDDRRVIPIGLPRVDPARQTRLALDPRVLATSTSTALPCNPRLAEHRVRLSWRSYFEPDAPYDVRRGRLLKGR